MTGSVVENEGARLHYRVRGEGPALMLVAGTGYSGETWDPGLCADLAGRHTLVTFDHRGTGRSTGTDGDYTTALFARDALAVLRAAGVGHAHLLGHSMGGRVATEMYFAEPSQVRSLVMAASGAGSEEPRPVADVGIPVRAVRGMVTAGYEQYIRDKHRSNYFTEEFCREHPDRVAWLDRAWEQSKPGLDDYLKHVRARQAHGARRRLPAVWVPVLVVVGTADTYVGGTGSHLEGAHVLHRLVPDSRLELLPGQKHGFLWEDVTGSRALVEAFTSQVEAGIPAPDR